MEDVFCLIDAMVDAEEAKARGAVGGGYQSQESTDPATPPPHSPDVVVVTPEPPTAAKATLPRRESLTDIGSAAMHRRRVASMQAATDDSEAEEEAAAVYTSSVPVAPPSLGDGDATSDEGHVSSESSFVPCESTSDSDLSMVVSDSEEEAAATAASTSDLGVYEKVWREQYGKVKRFYDQNKRWPRQTCNSEEAALGRWCSTQRKLKGTTAVVELSASARNARIALLDKINFDWTTRSDRWESHFNQAKAFYAKHGRWPSKKKQGSLGPWCENQKSDRIHGKISEERKAKLTEAGFVWGRISMAERWEARFDELQKFYAQHNRWPFEREGQLGSWCARMRQARKGNVSAKISDAQAAKLDGIGFDWGSTMSNAEQWEARFCELKEFRNREERWPKFRENAPYRTLGRWCATQKEAKKGRGHNKITLAQIAKLESIGFDCLPGGLKRPVTGSDRPNPKRRAATARREAEGAQ